MLSQYWTNFHFWCTNTILPTDNTVYKALAFILLSMFNYTTDRDIDRPYFCSIETWWSNKDDSKFLIILYIYPIIWLYILIQIYSKDIPLASFAKLVYPFKSFLRHKGENKSMEKNSLSESSYFPTRYI